MSLVASLHESLKCLGFKELAKKNRWVRKIKALKVKNACHMMMLIMMMMIVIIIIILLIMIIMMIMIIIKIIST